MVESPIFVVVAQNRYTEDPAFNDLLARHLTPAALERIDPWLREMGRLSAGPINELAFQADAHPPVLE